MDNQLLTLQDLADETGVEPRTIRSYVERGIIPGPDSLGRGARYPRESLDSLKVLQLLRDADRDISLDRARLLLQRLTPSQLRNVAEGRERIAAVFDTDRPTVQGSREDALAYLARLKQRSSAPGEGRKYAGVTGRIPSDTTLPVLEQAAKALGGLVGLSAPTRSVRGESWYRLPLTPDIELSFRIHGEFGPEQLAQWHRIGDALRILLTKGAVK